ncbi:hypothetical protein LTR36_009815 [Oleoguttula mirabilis]|uniref:Apple domain-containing protein n=1 Tax=Oleoguttula mirabilis TaxID=1507867 RepID=A0AAV9J5Z8_9PEZI|nr:hypothetical protein LTR36_009815 [Oleoguttula mirabilis]
MKLSGLLALAATVVVAVATPIIESSLMAANIGQRSVESKRDVPEINHHLPANPDGLPLDPCKDKKVFNLGVWMVPIYGPYYMVHCDSTIAATLIPQAGAQTNEDCMKLCTHTDGCQGVVMTSANTCSLSTGGAGNLVSAKGISAWVATNFGKRSVDSTEAGNYNQAEIRNSRDVSTNKRELVGTHSNLDVCTGNRFNGYTITAPDGGQVFTIVCNYGLLASDLFVSSAGSLDDCARNCDAVEGCSAADLDTNTVCFMATGTYHGLTPMTGSIALVGASVLGRETRSWPDDKIRAPVVEKAVVKKDGNPIYDYDWVCTFDGIETPAKDIKSAYENLCWNRDGYPVKSSGEWLSNTLTINGNQIYIAVHSVPPHGKTFILYFDQCIWGFEAVMASCGPDGNQGGYIYYYNQFSTYLIGINGNTPNPCNGAC